MPATGKKSLGTRKLRSSVTKCIDPSLVLVDSSNIFTRSLRSKTIKTPIEMKRSEDKDSIKPELPSPKIQKREENISQGEQQELVVEDAELCSLVQQFKKLETILGYDYINVVKRLSLDFVPLCVQDMMFCHTHHSKSCPRPTVVDSFQSYTWQRFPDENRALLYLNLIEDMCIRTEFPGDETISKILELILVVNTSPDSEYKSDYVLQKCAIVLDHILTKFPPCWYDINHAYHKVVTNEMDMKNLFPDKSGSNGCIFNVVIDLLDQTMTEKDTCINSVVDDIDNLDSDDVKGFNDFVRKTTTTNRFDCRPREDKLDRIFLVLHFLTKILELDFSIWMLRHLSKPHLSMFSNSKPLLSTVFFRDAYNQITPLVKRLLKIFVNSACLSYPVDKIRILSRLVTIVAVAINLSEKPQVSGVVYPNIGMNTEKITNEIFNTIEGFSGKQVDRYLTVIKHIPVRFVRYLLIDKLLSKMDRDRGEMCVRKIVQNFGKNRWKQCLPAPPKQQKLTTVKYPVLEASSPKKTKTSEIYQEDYLEILLDALKSYCDVFQLRQVFEEVFCMKSINLSPKLSKTQKTISRGVLNLSLMEQDIEKLETGLKMNQKISKNNIINPPYSGIYIDNNIMLRYREDIKYLMILHQHMQKLQREDQNLFNEWNEFLSQFFAIA